MTSDALESVPVVTLGLSLLPDAGLLPPAPVESNGDVVFAPETCAMPVA
jgi:hypothetical protein